jgi:hypothetical protein
VSYFNELAVDPVFWMLHGELDRIWYSWETSHTGVPPPTDEDAVFQPLRPGEGRWYGGGRTYALSELVDHQALTTGTTPCSSSEPSLPARLVQARHGPTRRRPLDEGEVVCPWA